VKKRILFFIETGGPGGAEQVVLQLLEGFRNLGHEVFLSSLRTGWLTKSAQERGFEYYQLNSDKGLDLKLPFKIASLIKKLKVDVIHTHLLDSNFYGAIASKVAGIQHVGTEHGDVHHINKKKFVKLKLVIISICGSKLTAVSDFSAKKLISLGVKSRQVRVIPNPVKEPNESGRLEARATLDVIKDWVWVHVGNLRPVKDQATLIRGFAHCLTLTDKNQKLLLVGDGDERKNLDSLVHELGISDKVIFIGHSNQVDYYLSAGDGFLMSSISESMPMALLEGISYGLYPICSSVGGIPEILPTEQLFASGDFKKLGELCADVVNSQEQAKINAKKFSEQILIERSLKSVCEQYLEAYA